MIEFKSNQLSITSKIQSPDTVLTLYTDIECNYIGVITLSNKATKAIFFVKENNIYKANNFSLCGHVYYLGNK